MLVVFFYLDLDLELLLCIRNFTYIVSVSNKVAFSLLLISVDRVMTDERMI